MSNQYKYAIWILFGVTCSLVFNQYYLASQIEALNRKLKDGIEIRIRIVDEEPDV